MRELERLNEKEKDHSRKLLTAVGLDRKLGRQTKMD